MIGSVISYTLINFSSVTYCTFSLISITYVIEISKHEVLVDSVGCVKCIIKLFSY